MSFALFNSPLIRARNVQKCKNDSEIEKQMSKFITKQSTADKALAPRIFVSPFSGENLSQPGLRSTVWEISVVVGGWLKLNPQ